MEPYQADQQTQSTQPAQPVEPVQPVQPAQRVQPVQPVEPVQPEYVRRADPRDRRVVERYPDPTAMRATQIIYLVLGIIEGLLVIRVVLKLLGANPNAGFSSLIYAVTGPLVAFFQGVFPEPQSNGSVLELSALLAMVVYALVAWAIVRLIWALRRQEPPVEA